MLLCDGAVIDWAAVDALGTWVVGAAAIWVAIKANAIASSLGRADEDRADRAARAIATGLRIEVLTYAQALLRLAERLEHIAKQDWAHVDVPGHAAAAHEDMERVQPADRTYLPDVLSNLPGELARKLSLVYAVQKKAQSVFSANADYLREQRSFKRPNRVDVVSKLVASAEEFRRTVAKIQEVVNALGDYLGLDAEQSKPMV